jgi:enoyl-CoA hydratase/carnithine racemase
MNRINIIANHLSEPLVLASKLPEKVGIVTLNRPLKLNSLSVDLWTELNRVLKDFDADPRIHVIVLTGSGKAFCAGADVNIFKNLTPGILSIRNPLEKWSKVLPALKKPVIAAVNGIAFGGGLEIALMCDIILAHKNAKFGLPEIKLALIPGSGGTQRLTKVVGKYRAMEIAMLGEPISAEEAKNLGIVNKISENVLEDAIAIAKKIANFSLPAVCLCKKAVKASLNSGLTQGLETELNLISQALLLNDKEEGINAMFSKRVPLFTNS